MDDFKWTEANKKYLAEGGEILSNAYNHDSNDDIVVLDGIECRFMGRTFPGGYPTFMRLDKFLERQDIM